MSCYEKRGEEFVETFKRTSNQTIDGTVEFWDCFINGFVRTRHPSNKQLDTLPAADAEKIRRHLEEDYAQLFQAWLSRLSTARALGEFQPIRRIGSDSGSIAQSVRRTACPYCSKDSNSGW